MTRSLPLRPTHTRLAWGVATLDLIALLVLVGAVAMEADPSDLIGPLVLGSEIAAYTLVGAVLATRVPGNSIGAWLLLAGSLASLETMAALYSNLATRPASILPGASWAALLEDALFFFPIFIVLVVVPLIFPTGRLLSPRWRIFPAIGLAVLTAVTLTSALSPEPVGAVAVESPLARGDAAGVLVVLDAIARLALPTFIGAALSLIVRWRRAGPVERAQLKWLVATASVAAAALSTSIVISGGPLGEALFAVFLVASIALPLAIGVAVLRYRLYAIDHLISRTVSWAVISTVLVTVFVGGVLGLQAALAGMTQAPTVAVAASTLVAFGLFQPVRRRVQHAVDRRFDRARVDAERTAEGFAGRLRGEVAIDAIAADLERTVDDSIKPSTQGLWLRIVRDRARAAGS